MLVFFLLLVIVAMALGILGIVVKGLFYLLFTGIGLLLVAFFLGALWMRRRSRRRRHARRFPLTSPGRALARQPGCPSLAARSLSGYFGQEP